MGINGGVVMEVDDGGCQALANPCNNINLVHCYIIDLDIYFIRPNWQYKT